MRILKPASDLDNVHYIRTAADVKPLRDHLHDTRRACIIGGGYIGLEVAAVMARLGMTVTVVEQDNRLLSRVTGERLRS